MSSIVSIKFEPDEQIKYIPFEVMNDSDLSDDEKIETFEVFLTVPRKTEVYSLGTIDKAVIHIVDDRESNNKPI